jgi:hypothetical protein
VIALDEREEKVSTADEGRSPQLKGNGADVSQAARSVIYILSCPNPEPSILN